MEKQHVYLMINKTDKASYCTNIKETSRADSEMLTWKDSL